MTQPSPADELRAAAQVLRTAADAAETASPGPWAITSERVIRCGDDQASIVADRSCADPGEDADLPYIALMHPGVGHALADLLEAVGDDPDDETLQDPGSDRHDHCDRTMCAPAAALAVARAITGSQP